MGTLVQVVLERADVMDKALQYLSAAMFVALNSLLGSSQLYSLKEQELKTLAKVNERIVKKVILFRYLCRGRLPLQTCWE